jgi:Tol biopolymer transport system component
MKAHNDAMHRREFLARAAATVAGSAAVPLLARAGEAASSHGQRISYYRDGEIHVNQVGGAEVEPLTKGHWDFKPSWSRTGDHLVFFRRYKDDPVTVNWLSAICIMNVDGTGFHELTDATIANFNPTWTRDGLNTPIWNRKNAKTGGFIIMQSKIGGKPGEEFPLTDERYHHWGYSCLKDGRIFVRSDHPAVGHGYFLMTRGDGPKPHFEPVDCPLAKTGLLDRVSISPDEKKLCFEYLPGFKYKEPGKTLYIADFDVEKRTVTNLKAIANPEGKEIWYAYPRWIEGESAVVYHSTQTGKGQLYVYRLEDASTKRVSANLAADYRYPHGEAAPC